MTPLFNALACLLTLACAQFFWRKQSSLLYNAIWMVGSLALFCLFSYLANDLENGRMALSVENYPFRMLAIALCFSTTTLRLNRRRYLVLAQSFWLWIEIFGAISLAYRGVDPLWVRVAAILGLAALSNNLQRISKEMEFCLMVYWIAIWIFF
ncbi:MAG: hypothetical protein HUK20_11440 [Fibrobacter sp.]|nr:hypothetical protein [Fibrobacter sp.]